MFTPNNHPHRIALNNEVHARPYEALISPERIAYIAVLSNETTRPLDYQQLCRLCERYQHKAPNPDASHFSADVGVFRFKWERHSEFTSYTFFQRGEFTEPFAETVLESLPQDWLDELSTQQTIVAAHAAIQRSAELSPNLETIGAYFTGNFLVGSYVGDNVATAFTDFRIQGDGFSRILVHDNNLGARQAGRMLQRLFEIETYRMMALLAFPLAKEVSTALSQAEKTLVHITSTLAKNIAQDEAVLLDELTTLAAEVENIVSRTNYRFNAAVAYYDLVKRRIVELRETRIQGIQTFNEFMDRRLAPAMNTCDSVARRLEELSARIARASHLLRTRVDIAREQQNQALLASMDRRAHLQLRLQETVEGLSVAAITYYTVGLVGYAVKAVKSLGMPINPDVAIGVAIPVVAIIVALGVRHIRALVTREDGHGDM
jgi:uncharacterized membrane-anchored protein